MYNYGRYMYGWLVALFLFVTSCREGEPISENEVTLSVRLGSVALQVDSRAAEEDLIEGNCMNRVTMLIIDGSNKLAGIQDWNDLAATLPTEVSTTIQGLKPNTVYRMIAVANYESLSNFPNLVELTIGSDISTTITALNTYALPDAGDDYVVANSPQPLSLVQEFTTPASGQMVVEGELIRTYARIRIEIANRSENQILSVNSLKFGSETSRFGYATTTLMPSVDANIPVSNGNLNVSSADAITQFVPLEVPKLNDAAGNSMVAFDGYLYECKNTAGFEYSLNVSYPISTSSTKTVYTKGAGTNNPSSGWYMIGYGNNNYYLTASGSDVIGSQVNSEVIELDPTQYAQVIWYVTKSGSTITIQSKQDESKYVNISNSDVYLGNSSSLSLSSTNGRIYRSINSRNYYMYADNKTVSSGRSSYTNYTFYPLTEKNESSSTDGYTSKNVEIPLATLIDGVSTPTHIIRRNDFINVLVTVSYNENSGTIDFHVGDWNTGGGNVEFN